MAEGKWFVTRPSYGFQDVGKCFEAVRETDHRLYYGEVRKTWPDREKQSYVEKRNCLAFNVDEKTARAIYAAWLKASKEIGELRLVQADKENAIRKMRDDTIATILQSLEKVNAPA